MTSEFRETRLTIDLGGEQVEFVSLTAQEGLSNPFEIELVVASPLGELDLAPHIGERVGVTVFQDDEEVRFFNGYLTEAVYLRETSDGFYYNLSLRSFLYFADTASGFAIFQEKTVLDIIKEVFARIGFTDVEYLASETYEPYEYCVQYSESDFNFISRLMEQEGLYYFFRHHNDRHELVICDRTNQHDQTEVGGLAFNPTADASQSYRVGSDWGSKLYLKKWTERVASTGHERVSLRDFDFKKPNRAVEGDATDEAQHELDGYEHYDYPGHFIEGSRGQRLSKTRLEEFRAMRRTYAADTTAKGLCAGTTVSVSEHPNDRFNSDYLVVSTTHTLQSQSYRSGTAARDQDSVHFVAIPADTQFRPPAITPKPRVVGLESAIVSGPDGETIYTDEYGRVKVRFHWDRSDSAGERSTCWIRVSQTGGLGNVILPRVGHEVLVDFLHGDPDKPLITGRVFNAEHMPVYKLPANKTRALWRTLTYGDADQNPPKTWKLDTDEGEGGTPLANEIRFEDKAGDEEIFVHAQKYMNTRVRYDSSMHIGHNEEYKVGYDRYRWVKNDEKVEIEGNREYTLTKNEKNTIEKGNRETVLEKGNDSLTLEKGNLKIETSKGKIKIEAMQEIKLVVGKTMLTLTQTGATLTSTMIKVDGKAMTTVSAGGILTEKGALVKIN